jgi:hypothetical protein
MKLLLRHRPSPAMVVALIALAVAASGTAIAATKLVSGDSLIKLRSLSANRLRNHSVTGTQLNLNKLGQVPNAAHAFVAGSSEDAVNAQDAAIATTAKNAATLGGQPAAAFDAATNFTRTGLVTAISGQTVPLASFGPFALTLKCTGTAAEIDASSSEDHSEALGTPMPTAGTSYQIDHASSAGFADADKSGALITPSGRTYAGVMTVGVNFPGVADPCVANALISQS